MGEGWGEGEKINVCQSVTFGNGIAIFRRKERAASSDEVLPPVFFDPVEGGQSGDQRHIVLSFGKLPQGVLLGVNGRDLSFESVSHRKIVHDVAALQHDPLPLELGQGGRRGRFTFLERPEKPGVLARIHLRLRQGKQNTRLLGDVLGQKRHALPSD